MTPNASPAPETALRRYWPWAMAAAVLFFLAALGMGLYLQAALAPLVEKTLSDYAADHGIAGLRFDLRRITPWQADIHAIRLAGKGPASGDPLRLDSLVIDYSPGDLQARVIKAVKISGLVLRVEKTAAGWRLPGLPDRLPDQTAPPARQADRVDGPEWKIHRLEIRNSRLEVDQGRRRFTVPFSLTVDHDARNGGGYAGRLSCSPADQSVRIAFELDPEAHTLTIDAAEAALELSRLGAILDNPPAAPLSGRLAVTGKARLRFDPLQVAAAEMHVGLPDGAASVGRPWGLRVPTPEAPLATVKLAEDGHWTLHAPDFTLGPRDHLRIRDWRGRLHPVATGWTAEGAFNLEVRTPPPDASGTDDPLPGQRLPLTYRGRWQADQPWALDLSGQGDPWKLNPQPGPDSGPLHFTPRLRLAASGDTNRIKIEADAQLVDFKTRRAQTRVRIPVVSIRASGEGPWDQLQGRYVFQADNLKIDTDTARGRVPRFSVEGGFQTAGDELRLAGHARIARGSIRLPQYQLRLEGIRLDLPLAWPHDPATTGGRLSLGGLNWNDLSLGSVRGRIRQRHRGAEFEATHQSALLPGARLTVEGRVALDAERPPPRVSVAYRFERDASPEDFDFGALRAEWAGIHGNGRIAAEGRGVFEPGSLHADLRMEIAAGRLVMPGKQAGVIGLEGGVVFPDLVAARSAPRQQIVFERTYVGDIAATDGQIDFQIEPGGVFFLEQGQFKWCHGTIYLPATRVEPAKDDYDITLWCDRLKLARLLEQLGAAQAEGAGTVSGRIPLRIRKGQFRVNGGFLYSSPGEGGTIRMRGTDMLTAGVPPGTPQYNQLELARQALKEYDYDWVKLSLATEPREDLLRLKLQLSGRPTHPLPFIYDTRAGGFVPADPGSPGSRFEEIKLDVNFSLPLNRLLEYKDLLKLFS
ncbi:MAG: YdbH domain-containing protein [Desulfobacterales bacterium]|nr:YdbH domain-containing protein [Desulfobacterales bacterium]